MPTPDELEKQGMKLYRDGRFEDAAAAFAQAHQSFLAAGIKPRAAQAANDRGVAARQAARFEEAEAAFVQAKNLFEELGDFKAQGQVVGNLGALAESRDHNEQAVELYKEAIALFEKAGAADMAGETWRALSRLRMKQGKWFQALGAYDAGLDQIKHPSLTDRVLRRLLRTTHKLTGGQ